MYCQKCGAPNPDSAAFCRNCDASLVNASEVLAEKVPEQGMAWHKFLIYFSLFASAVLNLIQGFITLTGSQYGDLAEQVYYTFTGLKAADTIMGLFQILIAAFCVYTRFRLSGYKKNGPVMLNVLYLSTTIASLIYVVVGGAIIGETLIDSSIASSFTGGIVMVVVNTNYYKKRKHLFIN